MPVPEINAQSKEGDQRPVREHLQSSTKEFQVLHPIKKFTSEVPLKCLYAKAHSMGE